jgi:hypothetical protein
MKKGSGSDDFVEKFVYGSVNNTSLERVSDTGEPNDPLQWKEHLTSSTPGSENYWWTASFEEIGNRAPSARIEGPTSAMADESVFFDGSVSSDLETSIERYIWMIENEVYEGVSVIYAFATTGTKQIFLTVFDTEQVSSTVSHIIEILPLAESEPEDEPAQGGSASGGETPSSTSKIVINEFLSDPIAPEKEWIELYNAGEESVLLDGFTLYDGVGKIAMVTGTILASGFKVIYLSSSKLNQTGDSITLKNSEQEIIDSIVYGDEDGNASMPGKAHSIARVSDGEDTDGDHIDFSYTITPTPGSPNNITPKEIVSSPSQIGGNNSNVATVETPKPTFFEGSVLINEFGFNSF